MARIVDITDKLSFDSSPALVIRGRKLEVNADAPTMLKVMGLMGVENPGPQEIMDAYDMMLPERSKKEIEKLKVSFGDLMIIVESAVSLVIGEDGSRGEQ